MTKPADPNLEFLSQAMTQAAEIAQEVRRQMPANSITKADDSPVTIADLAGQAVMSYHLSKRFPKDEFVAEETCAIFQSEAGKKSLQQVVDYVGKIIPEADADKVSAWIERGCGEAKGRFWTMDPIDGTKGFIRGEQYAVALALVEDGRVKLGMLACPNLKEGSLQAIGGEGTLIFAKRGEGAWQKPLFKKGSWKRMRVSSRAKAQEAIVLRSVESAHTHTGRTAKLMEFLHVKQPPVLMDSLAKYAVVASGGADLLFRLPSSAEPDRREWIWDQAAGVIAVEEAGGRVTDLDGKPLDFSTGRLLTANRGVLVSNKHLHETALQALMQARGHSH